MKTIEEFKGIVDPLWIFAFVVGLGFFPQTMVFVIPAYFATQLLLFPDRYRGRSGSLTIAYWLFGVITAGLIISAILPLVDPH